MWLFCLFLCYLKAACSLAGCKNVTVIRHSSDNVYQVFPGHKTFSSVCIKISFDFGKFSRILSFNSDSKFVLLICFFFLHLGFFSCCFVSLLVFFFLWNISFFLTLTLYFMIFCLSNTHYYLVVINSLAPLQRLLWPLCFFPQLPSSAFIIY